MPKRNVRIESNDKLQKLSSMSKKILDKSIAKTLQETKDMTISMMNKKLDKPIKFTSNSNHKGKRAAGSMMFFTKKHSTGSKGTLTFKHAQSKYLTGIITKTNKTTTAWKPLVGKFLSLNKFGNVAGERKIFNESVKVKGKNGSEYLIGRPKKGKGKVRYDGDELSRKRLEDGTIKSRRRGYEYDRHKVEDPVVPLYVRHKRKYDQQLDFYANAHKLIKGRLPKNINTEIEYQLKKGMKKTKK